MTYGTKRDQLRKLEEQVTELRKKIIDVRNSQEPEKVDNYELKLSSSEKIRLSDLFGGKKELFVIHNMGRNCAYCTLWADGFNGILPHLENRAAFVVSSPDSPEVQSAFAQSRGWKFRMVSAEGSPFTQDLGFQNSEGYRPGVSVFVKSGNDILRVSDTTFGPGDDYCQLWHLFDLLPGGTAGWSPKFNY